MDPEAQYPTKIETEKMAAEARQAKAEGREYKAPPAFVAPPPKTPNPFGSPSVKAAPAETAAAGGAVPTAPALEAKAA